MDHPKTHFQDGSAGAAGEGEKQGLNELMSIIRGIECAGTASSKAPRSFHPGEHRDSIAAASAVSGYGLQQQPCTTDASRGNDNVDTHHINKADNSLQPQTRSGTFGGQYPCPFRQRNPARFNVRDSDVCARAWFADISAVKYVNRAFFFPRQLGQVS